jgi:hypothetical protein
VRAGLLSAGEPAVGIDRLRLAAGVYLAGFTGLLRTRAGSNLRIYFGWHAERCVDPLTAGRAGLGAAVILAPDGAWPMGAVGGWLAASGQ